MKEAHRLFLCARICIAEVHVLETLGHSDVVVVWNIYADGNIGTTEGEDVEVRKIRLREFIFFEIFGPGEESYELFCIINKFVELCRRLLVNYCNEPFKLSPCTRGVKICLNEANIRLYNRPNIFNPVSLRVLMFLDTKMC